MFSGNIRNDHTYGLRSEQSQNTRSCTGSATPECSREPSLCLTDDSAIADCFDDSDSQNESEKFKDLSSEVHKVMNEGDEIKHQATIESSSDQKCSIENIQSTSIQQESESTIKVAMETHKRVLRSHQRKPPVKTLRRHEYSLRVTEKINYSTHPLCNRKKTKKSKKKRKGQRVKDSFVIINKFRGVKMMLVDLGNKCSVKCSHKHSSRDGPHVSASPCILAKCKTRKAKKDGMIVECPRKTPPMKDYDIMDDAAALEAYVSDPTLISLEENSVEEFYRALHRLRCSNEGFDVESVDSALAPSEAAIVAQGHEEQLSSQYNNVEERACSFCGMYIADSVMHQHLVSAHKYRCHLPKCKQWFSSRSLLDQHRLSTHSDKLHVCVLCEKYFFSKRILLTHLQSKCHQRFDRVFQMAVSLLTGETQPSFCSQVVSPACTIKPAYLDSIQVSSQSDLSGVIISVPDPSPSTPDKDHDSDMLEEFVQSLRDIDLTLTPAETPVVDFDWLYSSNNIV
ncbi:hypothetical protein CAPTEDRAFT_185477 [Capitella teleta]|uniref:C2H2-type domain-containing protein n=1 Tax=Capitella teleta TaxID=283909 RepID=R7VK64_CAPTE|nr:hypothetical protein CAPTEDRAFT_185477 [Capitella teleta]|eukprot:ELU16515.1 hypothetical protein CAPTEDRAFT_185477 [Capitella teleta]